MLITEMTPNLSNLINNDLCNPVRERSHTLPSMISRAEFIRNSAIELKRATPLINLHQSSLAKEIKHEATLQPMPITKMDKLNAKDYVYLGSSEMRFVGDVGITLNSEGQLIMIQGCSHNLIMGLYHKYIQKKTIAVFLFMKKTKITLFALMLYISINKENCSVKLKMVKYFIRLISKKTPSTTMLTRAIAT